MTADVFSTHVAYASAVIDCRYKGDGQ